MALYWRILVTRTLPGIERLATSLSPTTIWMKRLLPFACLICVGCVHKPAAVETPVLLARTCPKNSVAYDDAHVAPMIGYCTDPPRCQHSTPVDTSDLCVALDPQTKRPLNCDGAPCVFFKGDSCNPYLEQDCDAGDRGKRTDD